MLAAAFSIVQVLKLRTCAKPGAEDPALGHTAAWGQGCDWSLRVYKHWNQLEPLHSGWLGLAAAP